MPKVTQEQLNKLNNQLKNDFRMDLMQLLRGDKVPCKVVDLNEKQFVKASLYFMERYTKDYNKTINIELNISLWHREESGTSVSHGLGNWYVLEQNLERKTFKKMVELTGKINDELIVSLYEKGKEVLNNGLILK